MIDVYRTQTTAGTWAYIYKIDKSYAQLTDNDWPHGGFMQTTNPVPIAINADLWVIDYMPTIWRDLMVKRRSWLATLREVQGATQYLIRNGVPWTARPINISFASLVEYKGSLDWFTQYRHNGTATPARFFGNVSNAATAYATPYMPLTGPWNQDPSGFGFTPVFDALRCDAWVVTSDNRIVQVGITGDNNINGGMGYHLEVGLDLFGATFTDFKWEFVEPISGSEPPDMARHQPRRATDLVGIYLAAPESFNVNMGDLYEVDFSDLIQRKFFASAGEGLLAVWWFYGIIRTDMSSSFLATARIGTVPFGDMPMAVPDQEFVTLDLGTVTVPRKFGDYRDYQECSYQVYLPFAGHVELDANDVVAKTLNLRYKINLTSGQAQIELTNGPSWSSDIIFTTSVQYGYSIPIRITPGATDIFSVITRAVGGLLGAEGDRHSAGDIGNDAAVMMSFQPHVIAYHPDSLDGSDFVEYVGLPANATARLGDLDGYVRMDEVFNAGSALGMRQADAIIELLKEGVYL